MLKVLMLLLTLPLFTSAFAEDVKSVWIQAPPTIDGDGDEWRDIAFSYFDDDKTAIALSNDSTAVYLMIISKSESTIMQLERSGVAVWLNGDGKKKRDYGVRYRAGRLSNTERKMPEGMPIGAEMEYQRENMKQEQARLRRMITVIEKKASTEIPSNGDSGPAAAATFGKDIYAVEFKIPIVAAADSGYGLAPKEGSDVMLGVEIGYMTDAEKAKMQERMRPPDGEGRGGGMGGPPSGGGMGGGMGGGSGMGGPGGGQGRPGGMRNSVKKEFWLKFGLAVAN